MKLYYDLHIHSCLSPCAADEMTPNNIINMSLLKGLDVIAVTDHNAIGNVAVCSELAERSGLILVPGIEVHAVEDVHVLCYFPSLEALTSFHQGLQPFLSREPNNSNIMGNQFLCDRSDRVVGNERTALILPLGLTLQDLAERVHAGGGLFVPAHVHRGSYGLLSRLGFIPPDLHVDALECDWSMECVPGAGTLRRLFNSDAHTLGAIHEAVHSLEVNERSLDCVLEAIGQAT